MAGVEKFLITVQKKKALGTARPLLDGYYIDSYISRFRFDMINHPLVYHVITGAIPFSCVYVI